MNETDLKHRRDEPLLNLILRLGSCPIISPFTWFPFGWSFVDHLVYLNRLVIHPFFVITPTKDLRNGSKVLLTVRKLLLLLLSWSFAVDVVNIFICCCFFCMRLLMFK